VRIGRRSLLFSAGVSAGISAGASLVSRVAFPAPEPPPPPPQDLEIRDLRVDGDRALARRFLLFRPKYMPRSSPLPLLVLLHGLGETIDETLGVRAWVDRYGLGTAFDRLRRPPVARTFKRPDLQDERLAAINADLLHRPFYGFAIVCPFTPKITAAKDYDAYARWIVDVVIPKVRSEIAIREGSSMIAIDGCSLGGFLGLEVFLRSPGSFGAWGGVQTAITEPAADRAVERMIKALEESGPKKLHIETSTEDVFRSGNEHLAAELTRRGIPNEFLLSSGWHDQPWLREAGTIEMLLWHDRRFYGR
jgi:hypothetical protein